VNDLSILLERVCQQLIQRGRLTTEDLQYVKRIQESEGGDLDDLLVGAGILSEEVIQRSMAEQLGCYFWSRDDLHQQIERRLCPTDLLQETFVRQHLFIPLSFDAHAKVLKIIVSRPPKQAFLRSLRYLVDIQEIVYDFATRASIADAIFRFFNSAPQQTPLSQLSPIKSYGPEDDIVICKTCSARCYSDYLVCEACGTPLQEGGNARSLKPGEQIGPYHIDETIARGGMAEIYLATNLQTGEQAALKILQKRLSEDRSAIKRFQREARALRQLQHPNIVKLLDYGFEEKVGLYIATEYLKGREFLDYMRDFAPIPWEELEPYIISISEALHFAHLNEIVHRDLKPDNILLIPSPDGQGEITKLIDFGLAKLLDDPVALTQTGLALGTPRYISPEQVSAKSVDARTDIYSFAVIMFEALTARPLFDVQGGYEMMTKHLYAPAPTIADARPDLSFPPGLVRVLKKSLAKDPNQRPATFQDFIHLLKEVTTSSTELEAVSPLRTKSMGLLRTPNATAPNMKKDPDHPHSTSSEHSQTLRPRPKPSSSDFNPLATTAIPPGIVSFEPEDLGISMPSSSSTAS